MPALMEKADRVVELRADCLICHERMATCNLRLKSEAGAVDRNVGSIAIDHFSFLCYLPFGYPIAAPDGLGHFFCTFTVWKEESMRSDGSAFIQP